jgi:spoIIIJ-associated protein
VEEATQKALEELGVGLEDVEIIVLNTGKNGILGLGSENARIKVKKLTDKQPDMESMSEIAQNILKTLLDKIGIKASVSVQPSQEIVEEDGEAAPVILDIKGEDLGVLIGRRGQTLASLQYIVRLIISQKTSTWTPIVIDVEGYKQRRYEALRVLAFNIAEQVKAKRTSFKLEPMPAYERRIIHLALANDPDVTTESVGEGDYRKVTILLKNKK